MRTIFVLIPLCSFGLLFAIRYRRTRCWRGSALDAALAWALCVTGITEGLSVFTALTPGWVLALWSTATLGLSLVYAKTIAGPKPAPHVSTRDLTRPWLWLSLCISLVTLPVGFIAIVAAPNTWDSMTYHMSRVEHWIQTHTVAHYPTHIPRQLYQPPWAEFAILQFRALTGGDHFANLVQWFSMLGSLIGVSLIAEQLGGDRRCQIFASVVAATIPMGILQGSSTQNDYVVSFWLVCLVYHVLAFHDACPKASAWGAFGIGAALGLAILTKGTAYIFAAPLMAWMIVATTRKWGTSALKPFVLIALVGLAINLAHYHRNVQLYASPLGPERSRFANEGFTGSILVSNAVRNLALHLATPKGHVNAVIERSVEFLHKFLGVRVNDRRTTWEGGSFHISGQVMHEDYAGNPLHLALIVAAIVALPLAGGLPRRGRLARYAVALAVAFLIFSLLLKWQPWHSRLHLPLFVLWAPVAAAVLARIRPDKVTDSIAVILILAALPAALGNTSRPLLGPGSVLKQSRIEQYFRNRSGLRGPYTDAMQVVHSQKCRELGLVVSDDDWEYPLWVLAGAHDKHQVRIEHVGVANESAVTGKNTRFQSFFPCVIIAVSRGSAPEIAIGPNVYHHAWSAAPVHVFARASSELR